MSKSPHTLLPAKVEGIIFDCDGVILNSREANTCYYNKILAALGLPPMTEEQSTFAHMATVKQVFAYLVPEELHHKIQEIQGKVVNYYRDIMPLVTLEEGFMDFILWAQSQNIRMAIHTNRMNGMPIVLDTFHLHGFFDPVVTAALAKPKPAPDGIFYIIEQWGMPKENLIFVGDSLSDAEAAKGAQVSFAAYGNKNLEAAIALSHFKALQDCIEKRIIS